MYVVGNTVHWVGHRRFREDGQLWLFDSRRKGPKIVTNLADVIGSPRPSVF